MAMDCEPINDGGAARPPSVAHDPLTGVLSRDHFIVLTRYALERGRRRPDWTTAVFFIDLEKPEAVNESEGCDAGDLMLATAVESMRRRLRSGDALARSGGGEILVLCEDLHEPREGELIGSRLIRAINTTGDAVRPVNVSIGVALSAGGNQTPQDLIRAAGAAMYQARKAGPSRCRLAPAAAGIEDQGRTSRSLAHRARSDEIASTAERARRAEQAMHRDAVLRAEAEHRLKTPLTIISGFAHTLQSLDDSGPSEIRSTAVSAIARQAHRLAELVDRLLEVSAGEARALQPRYVRLDLAQVAADCAEAWAAASPNRDIHCNGARPVLVDTDPDMLESAVGHLVDNALKYSPQASPVTISARRTHRWAELSVADRGPGIPEEVDLFAPFAQGHNRWGTTPSGIGLGLHIVRNAVGALGGEVTAGRNPDGGSTFTLRLPLLDASGTDVDRTGRRAYPELAIQVAQPRNPVETNALPETGTAG